MMIESSDKPEVRALREDLSVISSSMWILGLNIQYQCNKPEHHLFVINKYSSYYFIMNYKSR